VLDASGNVFVTGNFSGKTAFGDTQLSRDAGSAAFISRLDPSGTFTSTLTIEGAGNSAGYGIALKANAPILLGEFTGAITIGTETLVSKGLSDVFVAAPLGLNASVEPPSRKVSIDYYPNPVSSILHFSSKQDAVLTDLLGRTVLHCDDCDQLHVDALPSGTYLLNGVRVSVLH
jgi:hypothetical protein